MTGAKAEYDPFARGAFPVGVRTMQARDEARDRVFPCEVWYPAAARYAGQDLAPEIQDAFAIQGGSSRNQAAVRDAAAEAGTYPLVLFSHSSGGGRRQSTFLCTHLSSHGYVVAALDHSELVAAELARNDGETAEQKASRTDAWMANRVPDLRFLLDHMLTAWDSDAKANTARIGLVGHSFGGWTVLATPDAEPRVRTVVALAPAGSSQVKPGILRATLSFAWGHDVPTLYLVAEDDISLPLEGMYELFARTPSAKQMAVLRRADHLHFMDDVERLHEAVRGMAFAGELAWISQEMRPIGELCSGAEAQRFARGLTTAHLDAILEQREAASQFLNGDVDAALAAGGISGFVYRPGSR